MCTVHSLLAPLRRVPALLPHAILPVSEHRWNLFIDLHRTDPPGKLWYGPLPFILISLNSSWFWGSHPTMQNLFPNSYLRNGINTFAMKACFFFPKTGRRTNEQMIAFVHPSWHCSFSMFKLSAFCSTVASLYFVSSNKYFSVALERMNGLAIKGPDAEVVLWSSWIICCR